MNDADDADDDDDGHVVWFWLCLQLDSLDPKEKRAIANSLFVFSSSNQQLTNLKYLYYLKETLAKLWRNNCLNWHRYLYHTREKGNWQILFSSNRPLHLKKCNIWHHLDGWKDNVRCINPISNPSIELNNVQNANANRRKYWCKEWPVKEPWYQWDNLAECDQIQNKYKYKNYGQCKY